MLKRIDVTPPLAAAPIRCPNSGADLLLQAYVNGDGIADMEIILQGLNGSTLKAGDFIL